MTRQQIRTGGVNECSYDFESIIEIVENETLFDDNRDY